jgi:glycosyltransferase involved in cell wall biosynthesis
VLPSAYETFSIACFEAAACGLPLVIPRLSGAGALVGDDEAGIIVNREAASIANALVRLACDPARRSALGAEARRRASPYTWEASVAAVTDIYRSRLP